MRAVLRIDARHQSARRPPQRIDRALRLPIGIEIGRHHEAVECRAATCTIGTKRRGSSARERPVGRLSSTAARRGDASTAARAGKPARCRSATSSAVRPKMITFSAPDVLADLDIGAVQRADGDGPVERELHVAGAGGFHAGGRNLLGQVGRRHDRFGKRGAVIGREHHLQPVARRPDRCSPPARCHWRA